MIRRGDRVRFAHRYVGEVVEVHGESRWVVVLWLDGLASRVPTDGLEVLPPLVEHHYGRWTAARRAMLRRDGDRMRWAWVWVACAPYPFDRRPVLLFAEDMAGLFDQMRHDELRRFPWAGAAPRLTA